jgi:hypothetical protein
LVQYQKIAKYKAKKNGIHFQDASKQTSKTITPCGCSLIAILKNTFGRCITQVNNKRMKKNSDSAYTMIRLNECIIV